VNTGLHGVPDAKGRLLWFIMTAGQARNQTATVSLPGIPPAAEWLIAAREHNAECLR
jgi:hypothetical protein